MSSKLGPIEILCEAPPYPIVQACHMIGIKRPEDVRWCRMSQFRAFGGNPHEGQSIWHLSLGLSRQTLWASMDSDWAAQLHRERMAQRTAGKTEDFREGVAAFLAKRPAQFQGR